MIKKLLAMVLSVSMLFSVTGYSISAAEDSADSNAVSEESSEWGDIVWGLSSSWNTLFPLSASSQIAVIVYNMLWEPLVMTTDNDYVWRAAESIDISEDGLTWTVHLNPDCTWSDGEPCTAEDWVWSMETLTDPEFGAFNATGQFAVIAGTDDSGLRTTDEEFGVIYVDEYTFEYHWKDPMSLVKFTGYYCWNLKAYPKHLLEDIPLSELSTADYWSAPVGNGCAIFVDEPVAGQELKLQARDDYYLGELHWNQLTYLVVDKTNAANALISGELDTYYPTLDQSDLDLVAESEDIYIQEISGSGSCYCLTLNNERFDANVRKAISLLIDKNLLVEALTEGVGEIAADLVPSSSPYYVPYEDTVDVEAAKALLDEAGWDYNDSITIGCAESLQNLAMMIQQMCAEAGLKIEIDVGDSTTIFAEMRAGERDAILASESINFTAAASNPELGTGETTMTHATNSRYQEIVEEIGFTTDEETLLSLYTEYQNLVREECPIVYLYSVPAQYPVANHLTGIRGGLGNLPWEWESIAE